MFIRWHGELWYPLNLLLGSPLSPAVDYSTLFFFQIVSTVFLFPNCKDASSQQVKSKREVGVSKHLRPIQFTKRKFDCLQMVTSLSWPFLHELDVTNVSRTISEAFLNNAIISSAITLKYWVGENTLSGFPSKTLNYIQWNLHCICICRISKH